MQTIPSDDPGVCQSIRYAGGLYKNGWTDQRLFLSGGSRGSKEHCIRRGLARFSLMIWCGFRQITLKISYKRFWWYIMNWWCVSAGGRFYYVVHVLLLTLFLVDAATLKHHSTSTAPPIVPSLTGTEPWLHPCGTEPHSRTRRSARFRSYWQKVFDNLEVMARSMAEIVEEIVHSYVSTISFMNIGWRTDMQPMFSVFLSRSCNEI